MNAVFTWTLPSVNGSGFPQNLESILHTAIYTSANNGADWALVELVDPSDPQTTRQDNMSDGPWQVRATIIGTNGKSSLNPAVVPFVIDDSAPGDIVDLLVTIE